MKKRIVWLAVSGLMALSLVLASCGPAVTEEEEVATKEEVAAKEEVAKEEVAKEEVTKEGMVLNVMGKLVEAPQYGGTFTHAEETDAQYWDVMTTSGGHWVRLVSRATDSLTGWDQTKGPTSANPQWTGLSKWFQPNDVLVGSLAESWEIMEPDTLIWHIRQGVHFQNKAPCYGAEMTADDVVWTFVRDWATPGSMLRITYAYLAVGNNSADYTWDSVSKCIYVDPDDPWAVVIKTIPGQIGGLWEQVAGVQPVVPKAYESIGGTITTATGGKIGKNIPSWKYLCGTGPFILTDYVPASSLTFTRNPDYWSKDQLHPENQLPYIDTYKELIMPDRSSRIAALRTGKLDHEWMLEWDDAQSLWKSNPEMKWVEYLENLNNMQMSHDIAPFDNMNVRRAMMMAIDYPTILQDLYEGHGLYYFGPAVPIPEHSGFWVPLDELGLSSDGFDIQKLYTYHPGEAAKLLDEAGLPRDSKGNRFTTSCTCYAEVDVDMLSIIQNYWADVGVTLNIDVKDSTVFKSMGVAHLAAQKAGGVGTFPNGSVQSLSANQPNLMTAYQALGSVNYAHVNDPTVEEAYAARITYYFDRAKREQILKSLMPEIISHANLINLPAPYSYIFWQPWVKGFHGEKLIDYLNAGSSFNPSCLWIDQDLKEEMTGRR